MNSASFQLLQLVISCQLKVSFHQFLLLKIKDNRSYKLNGTSAVTVKIGFKPMTFMIPVETLC